MNVFDDADNSNGITFPSGGFSGEFHAHRVRPSIGFDCGLIDNKGIAVGWVSRRKEASLQQLDIKDVEIAWVCIDGIESNIGCMSRAYPLPALLCVHRIREIRRE